MPTFTHRLVKDEKGKVWLDSDYMAMLAEQEQEQEPEPEPKPKKVTKTTQKKKTQAKKSGKVSK